MWGRGLGGGGQVLLILDVYRQDLPDTLWQHFFSFPSNAEI